MNWDAIGALGEVIGATAVVVTLVYLARQVRHASEEAGQLARQHEDERTADLVQTLYAKVQETAALKLEHWNLSHVLELPETYAEVRDRIRIAVADASDSERVALLEAEKTIAAMQLIQFEETHYHYSLAVRAGNETREAIVGEILAYYTMGALRNPRLLWLASPEGGNLASHLNATSLAYYEATVLENDAEPLSHPPDSVGVVAPTTE
ncbi:MAG: hypothetical protein OER77_07605 [Myxococcales bacterium]|nr:hypothetical protein [Myxococcales bacterium]